MKRPTPGDLELLEAAEEGLRYSDQVRRADLWTWRGLSVAAWVGLVALDAVGLAAGLGAW
jgi:hypothetical protein